MKQHPAIVYQFPKVSCLLGLIIILFIGCAPRIASASATSYSNFVAFGDSLTDNGTNDGYGIKVDSDGSVWTDYLANSSHLNTSLVDFACVGATTGTDNPSQTQDPDSGIQSQVNTYLDLTSSNISSSTLISLWGGADDLFQNRSYSTAISNIGAEIQQLASAGGKNFLMLNLPNIGATPYFQENEPGEASAATAWCQAFNAGLASEISNLQSQYPTDNFYTFNVYNFFNQITADPTAYGFANESAIYWTDGLHPSTETHSLIADDIYAELQSVPEPSSAPLILFSAALVSIAVIRNRRPCL